MSRKKKTTESEESASVATLPENDQPIASMSTQRPDWIDGAPVTAEGNFIREGYSPPTGQMQLSKNEGAAPPSDVETAEATQGKSWGDPYKSIFNCPEMGFELGENRRYKQRVFHFNDRPSEEILAELKEHKFVYRGAEKAWTLPANAETRKLTDELARKWAGPSYVQGIER